MELGRESLPPECEIELGKALRCYLDTERIERHREDATTPGNVRTELDRVCVSLRKALSDLQGLVAADSGVDSTTLDRLRRPAEAFLGEASRVILELNLMPRIIPSKEPLRLIGHVLSKIFAKHVLQEFNSLVHRRRFAFRALRAVAPHIPGIDEQHLDRLDPYLNAAWPR